MVQHVLWRGSTRNIKDAIPRPAGVTHERHGRDLDLNYMYINLPLCSVKPFVTRVDSFAAVV